MRSFSGKKCLRDASSGDKAFGKEGEEEAESEDDIMECNAAILGCSISVLSGRGQEQMLAS